MDMYALKQVNWITNTLWLLFYTIALLAFLAFFWRDYIDDFKKANVNYRREEILVSETHKQYTNVLSQKNGFESQNAQSISKMHSSLGSGQLQNIFSGATVKTLQTPNQKIDNVTESRFQVSGTAKNTKELKEMIAAVQNSPYVMELNFPVKIEKTKAGLKYTIGVRSFNTTLPASGSGFGTIPIPPSAMPDSIQR